MLKFCDCLCRNGIKRHWALVLGMKLLHAYTYTASASVVCHVGAKLVLVDTAKNSHEMDYDKLEAAITDKTKAVIPVDLAGIMCDYDRILRF